MQLKYIRISFMFVLLIFLFGCSEYKSKSKSELEQEIPLFDELVSFFVDDSLSGNQGFINTDRIKSNRIKNIISKLKAKNKLSQFDRPYPSSIYVGNRYCIIFFIKKENNLFTEDDYLLIYSADSLKELACLGELYSIFAYEEVNGMKINISTIGGNLTYVIVHHDKITGL